MRKLKGLGIVLIICGVFCMIGGMFGGRDERTVRKPSEWNLILVNKESPIPEDYEVELVTLSNGEQIDKRIYPALQEMFDTARENGVFPVVRAGYRTEEKQRELLEEKINEYKEEGHSTYRAKKLAGEYVAAPGTSEHQLGIAVDINADTSKCSREEVYEWLAEHAYTYGFIKRYPEDKIEITGIANEPWHYRYVGEAAAKEMYEKELCLEEYVKKLK